MWKLKIRCSFDSSSYGNVIYIYMFTCLILVVFLLSIYLQSYTKAADFEIMTCCISSELNIIGFLESSKVECPATLSRHLVLPQRVSDECIDNNEASSKTPSFCVLLHGALKVPYLFLRL